MIWDGPNLKTSGDTMHQDNALGKMINGTGTENGREIEVAITTEMKSSMVWIGEIRKLSDTSQINSWKLTNGERNILDMTTADQTRLKNLKEK